MSSLPSATVAGLLLAAISHLKKLGLATPAATDVITALGTSRTTAYKAKSALVALLPKLLRPPGRPAKHEPLELERAQRQLVLRDVALDFVYAHPGCVSSDGARRCYYKRFRCFVLDLVAEHRAVSLEDLAEAVHVPLGTLKDWLRGGHTQTDSVEPVTSASGATIPQVETVLTAWETWDGGFRDFCQHVQLHWRVPLSRQHISDILEAEGVRIPKRRTRRPPDASALRGGFVTFFPGAQWVGDGTELVVEVCGQRFICNLELHVDTDSGAFVGASLRATEDADAVVEAFSDGVTTTGAPPLALLLDNKPSNHGAVVDDALRGNSTLRIRSRPFVPTDKPHVEGAFGLFTQETPPMVITATTLEELAGQLVRLVVTTWARAVNNRPRTDRAGRSRVQLYEDAAPTEQQIAAARAALRDRQRKQERARETKCRRQDPLARAALDDAFERLGLDDPERVLRVAIASWPLDAILAGIAVFEGKKRRGTLPNAVDARYLRGIVKNIAEEAECWEIAEALLSERLRAQDRALHALCADRAGIQATLAHHDAPELLRCYVDRATVTPRNIDRLFWLRAAADIVLDLPEPERRPLLRIAARRIAAAYSLAKRDRDAAIRFLFAKAVPVS